MKHIGVCSWDWTPGQNFEKMSFIFVGQNLCNVEITKKRMVLNFPKSIYGWILTLNCTLRHFWFHSVIMCLLIFCYWLKEKLLFWRFHHLSVVNIFAYFFNLKLLNASLLFSFFSRSNFVIPIAGWKKPFSQFEAKNLAETKSAPQSLTGVFYLLFVCYYFILQHFKWVFILCLLFDEMNEFHSIYKGIAKGVKFQINIFFSRNFSQLNRFHGLFVCLLI